MRIALCQLKTPNFEFKEELDKTTSFYEIEGRRIDALDYVVGRLEESKFPKETLVVLPECVPGISGMDNIGKLKQFAKSRGLYVQAGIYQKIPGKAKAYNSSVLIDPKGNISGIYHKMYLQKEEWQSHIEPGDKPELFEVEQDGEKYTIGPFICQDLGSNMPGDETPIRKRDENGIPILESVYNEADVFVVQSASLVGLSDKGKPFHEHWAELLERMVEKYEKPIVYVNCADRGGRSKVLIPENGKAKIVRELSADIEEISLFEI